MLLSPELVEKAKDSNEVEQLVRTFTGRKDARVVNLRKVVGEDGKTRGYEVDIR